MSKDFCPNHCCVQLEVKTSNGDVMSKDIFLRSLRGLADELERKLPGIHGLSMEMHEYSQRVSK